MEGVGMGNGRFNNLKLKSLVKQAYEIIKGENCICAWTPFYNLNSYGEDSSFKSALLGLEGFEN